jgi:phosphorylase kinase gamma subunit
VKARVAEAPVNLKSIGSTPYKFKAIRRLIDGCAFRIYGHWVKRADDQNRATLFEHHPKTELFQKISQSP